MINNGYKNIEVEIRARLDGIKGFKKLIEKFEAELVPRYICVIFIFIKKR